MTEGIVDARGAALTALVADTTTLATPRVELDEAVAAYLERLAGPGEWVTGPLGVDAEDIDHLLTLLPDDAAVPVSVVVRRGVLGNLGVALTTVLKRLAVVRDDPRLRLEAVEIGHMGDDPLSAIESAVTAAADAGLPGDLAIALDVPLAGRAAGEVVRRIEAMGRARTAGINVMARLRLSAGQPAYRPTEREIAGFFRATASNDVPVMITAGRLAPGWQPAPEADMTAQGLLNLLGAAATAHRGGSLAQLEAALAAPQDDIRLGSGALIVGDAVLESELLVATRSTFLVTVGCSNPTALMEDLIQLGELQPDGQLP